MLILEFCIVIISLAGAFLVSIDDRWLQIVGFSLWVVSDAAWFLVGFLDGDVMLSLQFAAFLVLAVLGVWQRRRPVVVAA